MVEMLSALGGLIAIFAFILALEARPDGGWLAWIEEGLLGPLGPSVTDLRKLANGAGGKSQERLSEMIEWRMQRGLMVARGTIGSAAAFLAALLLAGFKDELELPLPMLVAAIAGALLLALPGFYVLRRLGRLSSRYGAILELLREQP